MGIITFLNKIELSLWKIIAKSRFSSVNCNYKSLIIGPDFIKRFQFNYPQNLTIGNNTVINGDCYINALGGVEIGKFCHIAKGLTIFSHNHNYESLNKIPYDEINIIKPVLIKDFVWCGANVTIVPGVIVGEGVVIGAGSVVTSNVPDYAVIGGNPARIIKYRNIEQFIENKIENRFF